MWQLFLAEEFQFINIKGTGKITKYLLDYHCNNCHRHYKEVNSKTR